MPIKTTALLLIGILLSACSGSETPHQIDYLFTPYAGSDVPGAAVLVARNGEIVFEKCFGSANLEDGVAVTPRTNFRLASVTKQFTALATMQLVAEGKISLSTTLDEVFDGFPDYGKDISIQHLLSHSSGLIDYESLIPDETTEQLLDPDVLQLMKTQDDTYFDPGSDYKYSNTAYVLLGLVIEEITGLRFSDYLERHVFQPAGMNATVAFEDGINEVPVRAFGYLLKAGIYEFADQSLTSALLGDGGIYSSLIDLLKWDRALENKTLLSAEWLEKVWTRGTLSTGEETNYGFGWRIDTYRGHRRTHHTGSTSGFRNVLQRYPDDGLFIVILTNRSGPDVSSVANKIADLYLRDQSSQ